MPWACPGRCGSFDLTGTLPFNKLSRETEYHTRVINKQHAKVSGMCDTPNSNYSGKGITENYSVYYGDAAGNHWSLLWLSKRLFSLLNVKIFV